MPDERLVTGASFDPSEIISGTRVSIEAIKAFERQVQALAQNLPHISKEDLVGGILDGLRDAARDMRNFQQEAERMSGKTSEAFRVIRDKVADLRLLSGQLQQSGADARKFATDVNTMNMSLLGRAGGSRGADNQRAKEFMITALSTSTAIRQMGHSGSQTAQHFVNMAAATLGADTAVARLAANVLALSVGFTKIAIGAGIIFAIAKVYETLTRATREAKKEQDDLVKSIQDRAKAERAANEAGGVAAINARIAALQKEREQVDGIGKSYANLTLLVILRVRELLHAGKLEADIRDRNAEQARIMRETTQARIKASEQELQDQLAITRATIQGAEAHARSRAQIAGLGQQSFGSQPGFVSNEERAATNEQIALVKKLADAEIAVLQGRRALAVANVNVVRSDPAHKEAQLVAARSEVDALDRQIELMRLQGDLRVQAIRDEQRVVAETRKAAAAEEEHARRMAEHGGGILLGAHPKSLAPGQTAFPTAAELEAIRKAALPLINQGAIQRGQETGVLGHAQEDIQNARALRREMEDVRASLLGAAANALGLGQNLANAVGSGFSLVQSFRQLKDAGAAVREARKTEDVGDDAAAKAGKLVALGGAISAGLGLLSGVIGGLFGQSALEKEHNALVRDNNQRLADLRISFDAAFLGAQGIAQIAQVLKIPTQQLSDVRSVTDIRQGPVLTAALDKANVSLIEFARLVENATGIQILDSKGKVVGAAWDQAREAIDLARKAATHFAETVQAHASQIDARNRIFGIKGASAEIGANRQVLLDALNLDEVMGAGTEARVAGLDLATPEGQRAYQEFLKELYRLAAAGKITAEALGEFENVDDVITTAADGADAVARAQEEAAEKIRAAAEKQAQALEQFQQSFGSLLDVRRQLAGEEGPVAAFHDALLKLAHDSSGAFALVGNVNVEDPKAREALRKKLVDTIDTMLAGAGNLEGLGISPEEVQPFLQFLQQAVASLDELSVVTDRLAEAENLLDLRSRLAGEDQEDATAAFRRQMDALSEVAPDFADMLEGFNLDKQGGREQMRDKLLSIFDDFTSGHLTAEDMGLSESDFLTFIGQAADFLDSFNESVKDATKTMTNVPTNLNIFEHEWWTRQVLPGRAPDDLPTISPQGVSPRPRGGDGASIIPVVTPGMDLASASAGVSSNRVADLLESGPLVQALGKFADALIANAGSNNTQENARRLQAALDYLGTVRSGSPEGY